MTNRITLLFLFYQVEVTNEWENPDNPICIEKQIIKIAYNQRGYQIYQKYLFIKSEVKGIGRPDKFKKPGEKNYNQGKQRDAERDY
jgi:hypothetical protein